MRARLTDGAEVYPHRADLAKLPFWKCDKCGNFVGCHHNTKHRTRPLGSIPTPELREARKELHALIDPMWNGGLMDRSELYKEISRIVGWKYHTAGICTMKEANEVRYAVQNILSE